MRELLLVLNDVSEAALQPEVHGEVGQAPGNLKTKTTASHPPQRPGPGPSHQTTSEKEPTESCWRTVLLLSPHTAGVVVVVVVVVD